MGEHLAAHIPTNLNPADICTKVVPGGQKRDKTIDLILHFLNKKVFYNKTEYNDIYHMYLHL